MTALVLSALAVLLGAGVFAWVWFIPLPVTLAVGGHPRIPRGTLIALNGRRFGRVREDRGATIVVQPLHPFRWWRRGSGRRGE